MQLHLCLWSQQVTDGINFYRVFLPVDRALDPASPRFLPRHLAPLFHQLNA